MFLFFYENSFSLIQNVGNICWWLSLSNCHAGGKYFSVFLKILLRVLFIHFCSIQWFLWERSVHTLCSFLFQSLLAPSNSWSLSCLKHCPFYPSVLYLHSFSPSLPSLFFVSSYSLHLIKISLISLRNPFFLVTIESREGHIYIYRCSGWESLSPWHWGMQSDAAKVCLVAEVHTRDDFREDILD